MICNYFPPFFVKTDILDLVLSRLSVDGDSSSSSLSINYFALLISNEPLSMRVSSYFTRSAGSNSAGCKSSTLSDALITVAVDASCSYAPSC